MRLNVTLYFTAPVLFYLVRIKVHVTFDFSPTSMQSDFTVVREWEVNITEVQHFYW
jgi:hypothetical protein